MIFMGCGVVGCGLWSVGVEAIIPCFSLSFVNTSLPPPFLYLRAPLLRLFLSFHFLFCPAVLFGRDMPDSGCWAFIS